MQWFGEIFMCNDHCLWPLLYTEVGLGNGPICPANALTSSILMKALEWLQIFSYLDQDESSSKKFQHVRYSFQVQANILVHKCMTNMDPSFFFFPGPVFHQFLAQKKATISHGEKLVLLKT